ncbi:MAG: hypothetical protein ACPGSI_10265, partial [Pikeienuella sp.]
WVTARFSHDLARTCLRLFVIAKPNLSIRRIGENNALPYAQRWKRINDDLPLGAKSRLGRFGQLLLAIGLAMLTLSGFFGFVLQIGER